MGRSREERRGIVDAQLPALGTRGSCKTEASFNVLSPSLGVISWGRIEYLKTFGSLERETLIKIIILIGIARSAYLEPHLAILNRAS